MDVYAGQKSFYRLPSFSLLNKFVQLEKICYSLIIMTGLMITLNELQGLDRFISFVLAWHEDIHGPRLRLSFKIKLSKTGESKTHGATISVFLFCLIMSTEEHIPTFLIGGVGGSSQCYSTVESLRVSQGREWHPPPPVNTSIILQVD